MEFLFIDRINQLERNVKISSSRALTLSEEYFQDHFPNFPIMPGVLMLETLVQAAQWLLRISQDFKFSSMMVSEVKMVKYAKFVRPGQTLYADVELKSVEDDKAEFKAKGLVKDATAITAVFKIRFFNIEATDGGADDLNAELIKRQKALLKLIYWPNENAN